MANRLLTNYGFTTYKIEGLPISQGGENYESTLLSADVPFGYCVVADGVTGAAKLPSATGQVQLGILAHWDDRENYSITQTVSTGVTRTVPGQKAKSVGRVMTRGKMAVYADQAMALGDPVFVRFTATATSGQVGVIRKDADTAKADEWKFLRVVEPCAAGGLCVIEVSR